MIDRIRWCGCLKSCLIRIRQRGVGTVVGALVGEREGKGREAKGRMGWGHVIDFLTCVRACAWLPGKVRGVLLIG